MDIFDVLMPDEEEPTIDVNDNSDDNELKDKIAVIERQLNEKERKRKEFNQKLTSEIKSFIESQVSKVQITQNVVERVIEKQLEQVVKHVQVPVHLEPQFIKSPPQIIRETRVEVQTEKKDHRKLVEEKTIDELRVEIKGLKNELERLRQTLPMMGGPGVIGIPPPEPNPVNYVLTVDANKKAAWKASSGGGLAAATFSISNNTPSYSFDSTGDTVDNLYQIVATLIRKLQGEI